MQTNYTPKNLLALLGKNSVALLVRGILDRIPVVVLGENCDDVDAFINGLIAIVPHRREYRFGFDFLTKDEYQSLVREEENDFSLLRNVYRTLVSTAKSLFDYGIETYKGWIMGVELSEDLNDNPLNTNKLNYSNRDIEFLFWRKGSIYVGNNNWKGKGTRKHKFQRS